MEITLQSGSGEAVGSLALADVVFDAAFNESLIHQVVGAYMAAARSGTKAQKTRSQVSGGGAKPFRQKGTGRARAGTIRSPIWRSGGVTFAATPRCYAQKVNRKMYRGALRSILAELVRQERLVAVAEFKADSPKTKPLAEKLKQMGLESVLIVGADFDENLYLAARNIPRVEVRDVADVDPVSLIGYEKVLMTEAALKNLEERLS